jgi:hypothetical protein
MFGCFEMAFKNQKTESQAPILVFVFGGGLFAGTFKSV